MEKSSNVHPSHLPRPRKTPRKEKEREPTVPSKSRRQKVSKAAQLPEASLGRKERPQKYKPETNEVKSHQETEVKLKTTVVDIDRVRDDMVKEDNLEAAEQEDGEDELSFPVELEQNLAAEAEIKRKQQAKIKAAEGERHAWEGIRASFRHLHPALVLPFSPEMLSLTSDQSSLPPPSPPPMERDGGVTDEEPETDSPMM
ncbi:hypothetical protein EXN66_Car006401 [Channa argus]|uniref:Uncharacterized protein n=1 Tax=Channa argus TaxID=215402 RepID=A0A6G1PL67_CHAAH|nr:hypothetical protein EXN66_Car006401 [Channa argus]